MHGAPWAEGRDGAPASSGEALLARVLDALPPAERDRFEQYLTQTAKLAAVGELTAGAAHQLNNPLFAILGLVEFLLNEIEAGTKAHQRLTLIHETGLEIREILRSVVDFAREPADDLDVIDLGETSARTLELVRRAVPGKGVELVERPCEQPTPVLANASQVRQVLVKLVTSAQRAAGDTGAVTVEVVREHGEAAVSVSHTVPDGAAGTAADGLDVAVVLARIPQARLEAGHDPSRPATVLRIPLASGGPD